MGLQKGNLPQFYKVKRQISLKYHHSKVNLTNIVSMHNIRTELNSKEDHLHFDTADYIVFGFMLTLSAFTGLYYGCFQARKQNDSRKFSEYLTGDKKMKCFPVSMSLVARYLYKIRILI